MFLFRFCSVSYLNVFMRCIYVVTSEYSGSWLELGSSQTIGGLSSHTTRSRRAVAAMTNKADYIG